MALLKHRTDLGKFYRALGSRDSDTEIEAAFQPTIGALDLLLSTPPIVGISPLYQGWSCVPLSEAGEFGILELTATGPATGFPNSRGFYVLMVSLGVTGSAAPVIDTAAATRIATSQGTPVQRNWSGSAFAPPFYSGIGSEFGTSGAGTGQEIPTTISTEHVFARPLYVAPDQRFMMVSRIANVIEDFLAFTAVPPDAVGN